MAQMGKNLPVKEAWETQVPCLDQEDLLEKGMATHPSILAWRFPWTEEPGASMGLQRPQLYPRGKVPDIQSGFQALTSV